jgi:hypothetical protein
LRRYIKAFDRVRFPKTKFVGLMQYDGDLKLPANFLVTQGGIREHALQRR